MNLKCMHYTDKYLGDNGMPVARYQYLYDSKFTNEVGGYKRGLITGFIVSYYLLSTSMDIAATIIFAIVALLPTIKLNEKLQTHERQFQSDTVEASEKNSKLSHHEKIKGPLYSVQKSSEHKLIEFLFKFLLSTGLAALAIAALEHHN